MPHAADLFTRHPANPLLDPRRWPRPVNAVMNAGATTMNGATLLVARVEDRRGISHLGLARSHDGISNWIVEEQPMLVPEPGLAEERLSLIHI